MKEKNRSLFFFFSFFSLPTNQQLYIANKYHTLVQAVHPNFMITNLKCGPTSGFRSGRVPLPARGPNAPDGRNPSPVRGIGLCRASACLAAMQPAVPQQVFRNQLSRKNEFYSYEPSSENPSPESEPVCLQLKSGAHLCRVCGCLGPKTCSRCHQAHYCSKEHQTLDWRLEHKQPCTQGHLDHTDPGHNFLFSEFEIVIETEEEIVPEVVEKEEDSEITGSMDEALEGELDSMAKHESREDNIFQKFKAQIALEPHLGTGYTEEFVWEQDVTDTPFRHLQALKKVTNILRPCNSISDFILRKYQRWRNKDVAWGLV
uniref:Programmed cell death protein 2 n=1 Tax=Marmota marmota marmota TaxID=9994 RepID=A0A8C6ETG4_MARMA